MTPHFTGGSWTSLPAAAGRLTPQFTGGSSIAGDHPFDTGRRRTIAVFESTGMNTPEEMDGQKYRLAHRMNGNGTEVTFETTQASRQSTPPCDESQPPTPPAKDIPAVDGAYTGRDREPMSAETEDYPDEVVSYFNPNGLQRPGSVYTLSRVSFANQLAQLTSLKLPDADSLERTIAEKPTAHIANTNLLAIANTVRSWISRASDLLAGLDADDDVEWAAAGGRGGLEEVDNAVRRFERLINVYVAAIDQLQARPDIRDLSKSKMATLLSQTETIVADWAQTRSKLKGVKEQVELAMEWEDIWNVVLGDIGNEMGALNRLVFEIEEKRHKTIVIETSGGIDPAELDTIDEHFPHTARSTGSNGSNRFLPTGFPMSPNAPDTGSMLEDDSSLMALSARLQPLHASLTFVPIRLSTYVPRAESLFPTACMELEERRRSLETDWIRLKADADALQQELGEDKWIQVFRNANRSAERMIKSIEKAIGKIRESFEAGQHLLNPNGMAKKVEAYLKRKMHFGSAIEKVLIVIGNGLKDRLTVNGEIVRMHQDTQARWDALREKLYDTDKIIQELQIDEENPKLRDSMSTMTSLDTFSLAESPGSSPASSVNETPRGKPGRRRSGLPKAGSAGRRAVSGSSSGAAPTPSQKKPSTSRLSLCNAARSSSQASSRQSSSTPTNVNRLPRPSTAATTSDPSKPRWNSSVKTSDLSPLRSYSSLGTATTHTPPPKAGPPSMRTTRSVSHTPGSEHSSPSQSRIPLRSPLTTREPSSSPLTYTPPSRTPHPHPASEGRKVSFSDIKSSPGPYNQQTLSQKNRPTSLRSRPSMPGLSSSASTPNMSSNLRSSFSSASKRMSTILPSIEHPDEDEDGNDLSASSPVSPKNARSVPPSLERRAASSMAVGRRLSMLPTMARGRQSSLGFGKIEGRDSPGAGMGRARRDSSLISAGSGGSGDKPRWRLPA